MTTGTPVDDLFQLATQIVPYFMSHNAETDACDLLMEIERLDILSGIVETTTYQRVCLYLTRYIHVFKTTVLIFVVLAMFTRKKGSH